LVRQPPAVEIDQRAAAEILDKGQAVLAGKGRELCRRYRGREALDHVVAGVDLEDQPRLRADRRRKVGKMGAVGGANLTQPGAGAGHDVGQSERATDLY